MSSVIAYLNLQFTSAIELGRWRELEGLITAPCTATLTRRLEYPGISTDNKISLVLIKPLNKFHTNFLLDYQISFCAVCRLMFAIFYVLRIFRHLHELIGNENFGVISELCYDWWYDCCACKDVCSFLILCQPQRGLGSEFSENNVWNPTGW